MISIILASCGVVLALTTVLIGGTERGREWISGYPLGYKLKGRKLRSHSLLTVKDGTYNEFVRTLARSARYTLNKQVDKVLARANVTVKTVKACGLSWEHFGVILSHERRSYGAFKAAVVSSLRFLSSAIMTGFRDEYRVDGKLVAYSQFIVKGSTLRAMWFYQCQDYARCLIWFHTLRTNVKRGFELKSVHVVDAGPSGNKDIKALKTKFGFSTIKQWKQECDYEGLFVRVLPPSLAYSGRREELDFKLASSSSCKFD
ncbi:hypothetical protein AAMO2058_000154600 [Amorphochlora amoebiformis]